MPRDDRQDRSADLTDHRSKKIATSTLIKPRRSSDGEVFGTAQLVRGNLRRQAIKLSAMRGSKVFWTMRTFPDASRGNDYNAIPNVGHRHNLYVSQFLSRRTVGLNWRFHSVCNAPLSERSPRASEENKLSRLTTEVVKIVPGPTTRNSSPSSTKSILSPLPPCATPSVTK
jgi:hypothetical protein